MFDSGQALTGLFIVLLITLVLFLIMREVVCWYWKINEGIAELRGIREGLSQLEKRLGALPSTGTPAGSAPATPTHSEPTPGPTLADPNVCGSCGRQIPPKNSFCEFCGAPRT